MEGTWSCYRGGQFNGGSIVMLRRLFNSSMEGEWSLLRRWSLKERRMVMLHKWQV